MMRTVEAIIDEHGRIRLLEPFELSGECRALVTILDDKAVGKVAETALLSEQALAEDWNRAEEDAAWSHLQDPAQSS
ncbi:MAG: hypothetical protein IID44_08165 [Planctomycetes bacterium]|nr:hypothetical protein [Planctomycetota bacterium]